MYLKYFEFQVTSLFSTYMLNNKERFFDTRNIKLAMVKGDLLGDAFNVNAFHRCQVNNLLRGQLIPYNPDRTVITNYGSPGSGVTIREMTVTSIKNEASTSNIQYKGKKKKDENEIQIIKEVAAKKIKIENDKSTYKLKPENQKVFDLLTKQIQEKETELECPVCFETVSSPIFMCSEMHLICSSCYPRLKKCPECREKYKKKTPKIHRYAEKSAEELNFMRNEITKITTSEAKEKGHEGEEKENGRVEDKIKCEQGFE